MPDLGATVAMEGQSGSAMTLVNPCFEGTHVTVQDGDWNAPGTWSAEGVPLSSENVRILHAVTCNDTDCVAQHIVIEDVGELILASGSVLTCTTIVNNGTYRQTSAELVIADAVTMDESDTDQFWSGFVSINNSVVVIAGTPKSVTHFRFEAAATDTVVALDSAPSGWLASDRLYLPGTRRFTSSVASDASNDWWQEFRTIDSIDGANVTVDSALTNSHLGMTGTDPRTSIEYHFKPVIQNLTRDCVICSANPTGVRGHILFSHRCSVNMQYCEVRDMGRSVPTGDLGAGEPGAVRGRYALHIHHCYGPVGGMANGYSFTVHGCSINNVGARPTQGGAPVTWMLTIHDSHFGKVTDNDVNNYWGSGFTTEEGNESHNLIEGNRVMWGTGDGVRADAIGTDNFAFSGSAFWFGGPNNYVRNNIAANAVGSGGLFQWGFNFMLANRTVTQKFPTAIGQDPDVDGVALNIHSLPLLEFSDNEAFSCTGPMTWWWLGSEFETPRGWAGVIKNFHAWNWYEWGLYPYECDRLTVDGAVLLCIPFTSNSSCWTGSNAGDYMVRRGRIMNCFFMGSVQMAANTDGHTGKASGIAGKSIDPRYGKIMFRNCTFRSFNTEAPTSANGSTTLVGRRALCDTIYLTHPTTKISMTDGSPGRNLIVDDYVVWRNYQGGGYSGSASNFITQRPSKPPWGKRLADVAGINAKIYELPQAKVSIRVGSGNQFLTLGVG